MRGTRVGAVLGEGLIRHQKLVVLDPGVKVEWIPFGTVVSQGSGRKDGPSMATGAR
ncbi:MAG: hypothetical protein NVS3B12_33880 [Acidimicrobiales bacterium]